MEENKLSNKQTFRLDLRIVCVLLLLIIASMLAIWRPWDTASNDSNKITVTGQATIKAEPDQYQFNPYYEKDTIADISTLNDQIIKKLKELGVTDAQIKNNASQYGSPEIYYSVPVDGKEKTTLNLTITLTDKDLTQKVQDYLLTTNPKGSITPSSSYSTEKQKELTDKARDEAIADAKKRADKTAGGLGAKIGKVLEVSEGQQDGGVYPLLDKTSQDTPVSSGSEGMDNSISIQPGVDEFSYTVTVVFALK
ncbi:MAG: SIMPL domain-containing protein [bacterium]|nr:SIMPL domain-containing protein [bacterium]